MINPTFRLFSLTLHWYTIFFSLAVLISYFLIRRNALKFQIKINDIDNLLIILVPVGIIGARLYHVIDKWSYYQLHFLEIFYLWQGGLGIFGGLIFGFIGGWIYCNQRKINLFKLLDLTAPYLLLGQAIGRVGNYFNQEGFGPPTWVAWKVFISPNRRPEQFKNFQYFHPTFFYEALIDLVGFGLLLLLIRKKPKKGVLTAVYLIIYGSGRLLAEFFRLDTAQVGSFKVGYFIAAAILVIGLFLVTRFTTIISTDKKL